MGKKWAETAKAGLLDERMGPEWQEVVELWYTLEEGSKFASLTKSHATKNHPKAVAVWVRNTRKGVPPLLSAEQMEGDWWAWWKVINPEWRVRGEELVQEEEGRWDVLRCPGQNRFLNVVVCLKWWFSCMETPSESWKRAISDVKWVLKGMIRYTLSDKYLIRLNRSTARTGKA
ncbi:hypothetical protein B0H10DRAFT_1789995 [Mycena sp. CBHHK59/15]|nr:hypothetical protein B0H10DRAFT_1789995 [Mycena sp. CBHHK59/15]